MAIDIGRIAYQAYCDYVNDELDKWEHLGKLEQDGWRHASVAVLKYIGEEQNKKDLIG